MEPAKKGWETHVSPSCSSPVSNSDERLGERRVWSEVRVHMVIQIKAIAHMKMKMDSFLFELIMVLSKEWIAWFSWLSKLIC